MDLGFEDLLGSDREHEVYEAEVVGLQLGLHLLASERMVDEAAIFIDNQAVLKTLQSGKAKLLRYMFTDLNTLLNRVYDEHVEIRIDTRWIPGHEGVEGNEKADEAARDAGENGSSREQDLPTHLRGRIPTNPTAARRIFRERMGTRWKEELRDSPRREWMEALDPGYPSMAFFKAATELDLPRQQFAALVQLRMGHFPVASYLYRFKRIDSPDCPHCGLEAQTPIHLMMGCEAFVEERAKRDRTLGAASRSFRALLNPGPATQGFMEYLKGTGYLRQNRRTVENGESTNDTE